MSSRPAAEVGALPKCTRCCCNQGDAQVVHQHVRQTPVLVLPYTAAKRQGFPHGNDGFWEGVCTGSDQCAKNRCLPPPPPVGSSAEQAIRSLRMPAWPIERYADGEQATQETARTLGDHH